MNYTMSLTEREREVMVQSLKFLLDLLTRAAPAPVASPQPAPGGVESGTIQVNARIFESRKRKDSERRCLHAGFVGHDARAARPRAQDR